MHTNKEFVVVDDVERAIEFAIESVNTLGLQKYQYEYQKPVYPNYSTFLNQSNNNPSLFDDDYFEDEDEETIEMERLTVTTAEDGIVIESNFTGDLIVLNNEEMVELYDIIRTQLMNKYSY